MGDPKVETYMTAVIDTLVPAKFQVEDAMQRMAKRMRKKQDPQPMQLLALRRYVIKGGDAIVAAWPWTRVQRREHKDSIDALDVEARLVKQAFEDDNLATSWAPLRFEISIGRCVYGATTGPHRRPQSTTC